MKIDFNQTVFEKMCGTRFPEYYDTMYLDGAKPWEILEAAHRSIIKEHEARQAAATAESPDAPMNVHFQVEVKK